MERSLEQRNHQAIGRPCHYVTKDGKCRPATILKLYQPLPAPGIPYKGQVDLHVLFDTYEDVGSELFSQEGGCAFRQCVPYTDWDENLRPTPSTWHLVMI